MINSLPPKLFKKVYSAKNWLLSESWDPKLIVDPTIVADIRRKKTLSFVVEDKEGSFVESVSSYDSAINMASIADSVVAAITKNKADSSRPMSSKEDISSTRKSKISALSSEPDVPSPPRKSASFAQQKASDMDFGHMRIDERVKIMKINTTDLRDWYLEDLSVGRQSSDKSTVERKKLSTKESARSSSSRGGGRI
jgi:hypothetical protein